MSLPATPLSPHFSTAQALPPIATLPQSASPAPVPFAQQVASSSTARPPQVRLSRQGRQMFQDYFDNANQYPTRPEKEALLEQVKNSDPEYTIKRLEIWFANRRKASAPEANTKAKTETARILYPTLTEQSIQMLDRMLMETPIPNETHLELWTSNAPGANRQHVRNYVKQRHADALVKKQMRGPPRRPTGSAIIPQPQHDDRMDVDHSVEDQLRQQPQEVHLPTPSVSKSPEPQRMRAQYSLPAPIDTSLTENVKSEPTRSPSIATATPSSAQPQPQPLPPTRFVHSQWQQAPYPAPWAQQNQNVAHAASRPIWQAYNTGPYAPGFQSPTQQQQPGGFFPLQPVTGWQPSTPVSATPRAYVHPGQPVPRAFAPPSPPLPQPQPLALAGARREFLRRTRVAAELHLQGAPPPPEPRTVQQLTDALGDVEASCTRFMVDVEERKMLRIGITSNSIRR